jgi:hypothetical protein
MRRSLVFLSAMAFYSICPAQSFTKIVPQGAVGLSNSAVKWMDFDNDGDLDFLVSGAEGTNDLRTKLYQNSGNDNFNPAPSPFNILPQYSETDITLLNLNNDDRVDFLLMGRRIGIANSMSLIENNSTGFVDKGDLPEFRNGQAYSLTSAGDVNNDGLVDIFVGATTTNSSGILTPLALLYINNGDGFTVGNKTVFDNLQNGAADLVELDNDGDLDLIVSGTLNGPSDSKTALYINDGNTNFFTPTPSPFPALYHSSIDVADFNADGLPDVLLSGMDNGNPKTALYRNEGTTFTEVPLPPAMNRVSSGAARWGDYDNDGDPDILITGMVQPVEQKMALFRNINGQFEEVIVPAFEPLATGDISWGDYDNDGDLDIVAAGEATITPNLANALYILKNGSAAANVKPSAPTGLLETKLSANSFTLEWNAATDDHTPALSLTYNVSIRNTTTNKYLMHPFSADGTGKRSVAQPGNVGSAKSRKFVNIPDGTYSVKVQSIDGTFTGSSWTEAKIYTGIPAAPNQPIVSFVDGNINLSWSDQSMNEEYFVIERRTDGGDFVTIDSVAANTVKFIDTVLPEALYEYRVAALNPNGGSAYTSTVAFKVLGIERRTIVNSFFPNPVKDRVTIIMTANKRRMANVMLLDSRGVTVSSTDLQFNEHGEAELDVTTVNAGLYILKVKDDMGMAVIKLVKH